MVPHVTWDKAQIKDSKKRSGAKEKGGGEGREKDVLSPNCGETLRKPLLFEPSFPSEKWGEGGVN